MLHVRIGTPHTDTVGKTIEVIDANLMDVDYQNYDSVIINNAHTYTNLKEFATLCINSKVNLFISGDLTTVLSDLEEIAYIYEEQ